MKSKRLLVSSLLFVSILAFILMSMPTNVSAKWTIDKEITVSSISIGQTKGFGLDAWHLYDVEFKPKRVGGWNMVAWTNNVFQYDPDKPISVLIEFFWRDGPNDSWHSWRKSTFSIYNKTTQWIYSGSSRIEFKFQLCHFMDSPTGAYISIK